MRSCLLVFGTEIEFESVDKRRLIPSILKEFEEIKKVGKTPKTVVLPTYPSRSGRDSNPRAVARKLISSQPRYDHFDTAASMLMRQAQFEKGKNSAQEQAKLSRFEPSKYIGISTV